MQYSMPVVLIILKSFFKLLIDKTLNPVDIFKLLLILPIDASFLSISYGSYSLCNFQYKSDPHIEVQRIILFLIICFILLMLITAFSRKSEFFFVNDNDRKISHCLFFSFIAWVVTGFILICSVNFVTLIG